MVANAGGSMIAMTYTPAARGRSRCKNCNGFLSDKPTEVYTDRGRYAPLPRAFYVCRRCGQVHEG